MADLASSGWRTWVMGALLLGLSMLLGIGIDEQRTAVAELRADIRRLDTMIQTNGNRITRLEQTYDFQQKQLDRIERGVQDLINQHRGR